MPAADSDLQPFLTHRDFVRSLAQSLLGNPADVDDVEQRTWMTAMADRAQEVRDPRGWLGQVVRHHALQLRRTAGRLRSREQRAAKPEGVDGGHGLIDRMETSRELVEAVMGLSEPNRTALLMRYYEEKSVSAIALELGVRPGVIKGRIQRGLADLREVLARASGRSEGDWRRDLAALVLVPAPLKGGLLGAGALGLGALAAGLTIFTLWMGDDGEKTEGILSLAAAEEPIALGPVVGELQGLAPARELPGEPIERIPSVAPQPEPEVLAIAAVVEDPAEEPVVELPAENLVEELRRLAKEPDTYHREAVEVIERFQRDQPVQMRPVGPSTIDVAGVLLETVVQSPQESQLVRGGVFLAIADRLTPEDFTGVFDAWLGGKSESLELVRAAAIAAALRGVPGECSAALNLQALQDLQEMMERDSLLPAFYPFVLRRTVVGDAATALDGWLRTEYSRARNEMMATPNTLIDARGVAYTDYQGTAELLCAIWGTGSLSDRDTERWFVDHALMGLDGGPTEEHMLMRAYNYVVYSLSSCSDAFQAVTRAHLGSSDPLLAGVSSLMGHLTNGAAGDVELKKLRRLRYSKDPSDQHQVTTMLEGIHSGAAEAGSIDGRLYRQLHEWAADSEVLESHRALAMGAIGKGASWKDLTKTATVVLAQGDDEMVCAFAIVALRKGAEEDRKRRPKVVMILKKALSRGLKGRMAKDAEGLIEEYGG